VKSAWRLVLLCLLSLVLPMQGLAVSLHGHAMAGGGESTIGALSHQADADGPAPCHEPDSAECSVCAACCLAVALPGSVPVWRAPAPADAPQAAVSEAPRPVLASRLERPPRTTSL
jgi:hypothetical protein